MNDQPHGPAYRAAIDSAHAELRQLADTLNRIRARQEQISVALEALKLLVSSPELTVQNGRTAPLATPVLTMNNSPMGKKSDRVQALA